MKKKLPTLFAAMLAMSCSLSIAQKNAKPVLPGNPNAFFIVTDREQLWTVEIRSTEILYRTQKENQSFSVPYVTPKDSAGVRIYRSKLKKDEIVIKIAKDSCRGSVSDVAFEFAADVSISRRKMKSPQKLQGCGTYLADKRLNAAWQLESLGGFKVKPNEFGKELPYIDLHIKERIFSGFGGCNRVNGGLDLRDYSQIKFTDVISTKMMCLSGNRESEFMKLLHAVKSYHIENGRLYLFVDGKAQLVFKKLI